MSCPPKLTELLRLYHNGPKQIRASYTFIETNISGAGSLFATLRKRDYAKTAFSKFKRCFLFVQLNRNNFAPNQNNQWNEKL